jgi:hypothetical protein
MKQKKKNREDLEKSFQEYQKRVHEWDRQGIRAKKLMGRFIEGDKERNLFTRDEDYLTGEELKKIFDKSSCLYCNSKQSLNLDRIDGTKGYQKNNVIIACNVCIRQRWMERNDDPCLALEG